jgi:hypothetical protein
MSDKDTNPPVPGNSGSNAGADDMDSNDAKSEAKPFLVTDDFDLENLRVRSGSASVPSKEGSETVRIEKPNRMRYVNVHLNWRETLYIIPADEKRKTYLVVPAIAEQFPQLCRTALLVPYASQQGNYYLWPILLEDRAGRVSDYSESAIQRVREGAGWWCRYEADQDNRSYRIYVAAEQPPSPVWPSGGMGHLVRKGFEDRIVTSSGHDLIRRLLGQKA